MVTPITATPLERRREEKRRRPGSLLSPETVNHRSAAAAFAQVNDNSRSPYVKYRIVWQVVKVPLAHAHQRGTRRQVLSDSFFFFLNPTPSLKGNASR